MIMRNLLSLALLSLFLISAPLSLQASVSENILIENNNGGDKEKKEKKKKKKSKDACCKMGDNEMPACCKKDADKKDKKDK